ncbi:glutamate--cysteine ligase [Candidatus Thiothrix sp. Deng01]|uniref:Glutamate--cysteine ligase n=1 Tax=Candidatus Thiothrix phosphatis TaxID=3112415 RepID=A0ABU6D084_9GAMM|nr:glutamate--cysteine ligase [Candidatus Thiothrix sp. Deng01]MEB4592496.1 glutamate--cysteine ligase [Candidatus Thiothrix sp. Deng01]
MYSLLEQRLRAIATNRLHPYLKNARTGLEKESLRVASNGQLSQRDHPKALGSALTHPWITTDYSEALLELITPPQERAAQSLDFLLNVETFVYQQLGDELLWTTSMPCALNGEDSIRIAEYGNSNAGRMKHIYRQGLAWRYGKTMQVIAGIHFNYSIDEAFWRPWQEMQGDSGSLREFRDAQYMALVRNLQRYGWLIIYLFGSSPAICKSFLGDRAMPEGMEEFNQYTLYEPFGASLRMGNIGYTNSKESKTGVKVCYNTLETYVRSLRHAIATPCPKYAEIGVKVEGEYRQLNANILQIENEYYSTVRPKQPLEGFEKPTDALESRGIAYVELRSIDVNAFHPAGISRRQLFFLEVFMHFCLLQESPLVTADEFYAINHNQMLTAHHGRSPETRLDCLGNSVLLRDKARELLEAMRPVAEMLNAVHDEDCYTDCLDSQAQLAWNPDLTPSARMLEIMRDRQESFFAFASRKSQEHRDYFLHRQLTPELNLEFQRLAEQSLARQEALERGPEMDFDSFLQAYLAGTLGDIKI